jgi:GT2 family glycosyltransferase
VDHSKRELSIIIVNYRSWTFLENCLHSLAPFSEKYEILVVDNCSNDGNFDSFVEKYPQVQFIASPINSGFGGGCRLGVRHSSGDYFLFLNPDTIANEGAINAMCQFLKSQHLYGIVSCRQHTNPAKHFLLFPNFRRLFGVVKSIESRVSRCRFRVQKLGDFEFVVPDWVTGSVLMISRENYEKIGGWSSRFWMYYEDPDLCKRFANSGGKVALLTHVAIQHKHGGATRVDLGTTAVTKTEVTISRHVYINEHFRGMEKVLSHGMMIFMFLLFGSLGAAMGVLFFPVPKLKLHAMIWLQRMRYYAHVFRSHSWLSPRLPRSADPA